MPAYVIATETVESATTFDSYRAAGSETLIPFSGRFVVRGGTLNAAIVAKTSEGELGLALGLGPVLIGISIPASASASVFWERG